jgi:hypothetical protein
MRDWGSAMLPNVRFRGSGKSTERVRFREVDYAPEFKFVLINELGFRGYAQGRSGQITPGKSVTSTVPVVPNP